MNNVGFLKKQHLSMFDEKRKVHKDFVCKLYQSYISDKAVEKDDNWLLFSGFYQYFSKHFPAEIYEKEYIVGTNWHWGWQINSTETVKPCNAGHFIPNFRDFLEKGIKGKINEASKASNKTALETTLKAFSNYIKNYADTARKASDLSQNEDKERLLNISNDCEHISENPPVSFRQALQFIWFVQSFINMESGNAAISLGRADSYLYPYYKSDIEAGVLTREEALELIMCFYIKISEGDESCMLTVGGNIENELTSLFLEAQTQVKMRQPSIALRVSKTTSNDVLNKATRLVLSGSGMPAYFNDDVIIEGLNMLGFDTDCVTDYGIVGCYETSPQGLFSNTIAAAINLYASLKDFLEQKSDYSSFKDFFSAYKKYFEFHYANSLRPEFKNIANQDMSIVSPFASCVLNREKYLLGINIFGIGILIDSIYTIKKLVFDENYTTIEYLKIQAEKDFEDVALYDKIVSLKTYYGSNSDESNQLAEDITKFIGKVIQSYPVGDNVIPSPGLFRFTLDIRQRDCGGMVNGRKKGELLSYGIMPCATPHKDSLTSILLSCANISANYFPCGCPVMISLNKKDIKKEGTLNSLIKTFFDAGGFHLAVNTVDANLLNQAKKSPAEHKDVIVKISGYSTQFTELNENIQDAVIERAATE